MSDSCLWPPVSHQALYICSPSLTHTCTNFTWPKTLTRSQNYTHLFMHVHICRHTHTHTHRHRDHLSKQRHIEFLHTDTQTPTSPPPTTATITVTDWTTKTQSHRRHADIWPVPEQGLHTGGRRGNNSHLMWRISAAVFYKIPTGPVKSKTKSIFI